MTMKPEHITSKQRLGKIADLLAKGVYLYAKSKGLVEEIEEDIRSRGGAVCQLDNDYTASGAIQAARRRTSSSRVTESSERKT